MISSSVTRLPLMSRLGGALPLDMYRMTGVITEQDVSPLLREKIQSTY
jgi:hypothetical protein